MLARALAGQAGVPFFHAAGSELKDQDGQGARRVRDIFRAAKAKAPCVVFIDEIDYMGHYRTTLHQLLSGLSFVVNDRSG